MNEYLIRHSELPGKYIKAKNKAHAMYKYHKFIDYDEKMIIENEGNYNFEIKIMKRSAKND